MHDWLIDKIEHSYANYPIKEAQGTIPGLARMHPARHKLVTAFSRKTPYMAHSFCLQDVKPRLLAVPPHPPRTSQSKQKFKLQSLAPSQREDRPCMASHYLAQMRRPILRTSVLTRSQDVCPYRPHAQVLMCRQEPAETCIPRSVPVEWQSVHDTPSNRRLLISAVHETRSQGDSLSHRLILTLSHRLVLTPQTLVLTRPRMLLGAAAVAVGSCTMFPG